MRKSGKKQEMPFGGIVAKVVEGEGVFAPYSVSIQQTPKAREALRRAKAALTLTSIGISKKDAHRLANAANAEYQKDPDGLVRP